jgi:hypothetical protein
MDSFNDCRAIPTSGSRHIYMKVAKVNVEVKGIMPKAVVERGGGGGDRRARCCRRAGCTRNRYRDEEESG